MRDHQLFAFLVVLIFSTSFNLSRCSVDQHFESTREGQKIKANDRRTSGLVPYPRIGRNSESANFPRTDRATGLVHYPRVGRSNLPVSNINLNRYYDFESDADLDFYNAHDVDLDSTLDQDYEGYPGRPMTLKHIDKALKDGIWLIPDHAIKEFRSMQKTDESRSLYPNIRGPRNNQGQLTINGYTPRLGRQTEHDVLMSFL